MGYPIRFLRFYCYTPLMLRRATITLLLVIATLGTGLVVATPSAKAACSPPATTYGTDTVSLSVPSSGSYVLWVRMQAPSATSNQFMLQVNGGTCFNAGGSANMPLNTWTWINYQNGNGGQVMQAQLNAGNNSLALIGTQPNVVVDTVLALASTSCVPTGLGTNCTTLQSSPSGGASTGGTSGGTVSAQSIVDSHLPAVALSSGGTVLTPNGTSVQLSTPVEVTPISIPGKTIKEAKYYLNNHLIYTATKSPYTYKLSPDHLLAGTYTLTATTVYTSGETATTSEKIVIAHPWYKNASILLLDYWWLIILALALIGFGLWWVVFRKRAVAPIDPTPVPVLPPFERPAQTQADPAVVQPGVYKADDKTQL